MTKDELKIKLVKLATTEAKKNHRQFAHDAQKDLSELVSSGVERMFAEGKAEREEIDLAEENIRHFINKMCEKDRSAVINARVFARARLTICPIWPFC